MIRAMQAADIPAVLELIKALAAYERAPQEVITTAETMLRDGFAGEQIFYKGLVAEGAGGELEGIAIFYPAYSTWKGRAVYLDDLVVRESLRGRGIGKQLFDEVVCYARSIGARRLVWQVLDWNEPAIRFYRRLQAEFLPEWLTCRLGEDGLAAYELG